MENILVVSQLCQFSVQWVPVAQSPWPINLNSFGTRCLSRDCSGQSAYISVCVWGCTHACMHIILFLGEWHLNALCFCKIQEFSMVVTIVLRFSFEGPFFPHQHFINVLISICFWALYSRYPWTDLRVSTFFFHFLLFWTLILMLITPFKKNCSNFSLIYWTNLFPRDRPFKVQVF